MRIQNDNIMHLEQTWRWFGPNDRITLRDIKQTGATGIVTALHHVPVGEVWEVSQIQKLNAQIQKAGFKWSVVESLPVHEDIKRRTGRYRKYIDNYKKSIRNLGKSGIQTVCYNFIPVLGWVRTDLNYQLSDGSIALRFDEVSLAAFDLFILERQDASDDYSSKIIEEAKLYDSNLNNRNRSELTRNILAGLPGSDKGYRLADFQGILKSYEGITHDDMRSHLYEFLLEIIPIAAENDVKLAIHPDDPPYTLFGLPRIVSTDVDISSLIKAINSPYNGLTFCTGSFGARPDNNLVDMILRFGHRIHFLHLRNVKRENGRNFYESNNLEGDVEMAKIMHAIIKEQLRRKNEGRKDLNIPIRPDHGHIMLNDFENDTLPGYAAIGRLRGLAELRGLESGLRLNMQLK